MDGIETKALTDGAGAEPGPDHAAVAPSVEYSQSGGLVASLERLGMSIVILSRWSGFLLAGAQPSGGVDAQPVSALQRFVR